jgi:hypothetical protein
MTGEFFELALIILGGGLTIYGIKTKIGMLNIISIPVWIYLAVSWSSSPLLMITMIGLSFFQVIYLFKTM